MELDKKLLTELQRRLKIGNRTGVHLNAIPGRSRYKFDITRLSVLDSKLPDSFIKKLLTEPSFKFRISWKGNVSEKKKLSEKDQNQILRLAKNFEDLINETEAIEAEKGINTFGFGYPLLIRRDIADGKITVAPLLIWSLRMKNTKEYNTWEILRNEDDPIYLNEVLINHLENDAQIKIEQIPSEMLEDGLISIEELHKLCMGIIHALHTDPPVTMSEVISKGIQKLSPIEDKGFYDNVVDNKDNPLGIASGVMLQFAGLFSIFEVQKQNIINDFNCLLSKEKIDLDLGEISDNVFQPISSVPTDPSQQGILHALESRRNIVIQGPPGTGKSQTLTAVLLNALENHKKVLVVCEKRTALEVLYNALATEAGRGLKEHISLIKDTIKDRRQVVDSVRSRVQAMASKVPSVSKTNLDALLVAINRSVGRLTEQHNYLGYHLLGDKNWTSAVGAYLSARLEFAKDPDLKLSTTVFSYTLDEYQNLLDAVRTGEKLYNDFNQISYTGELNEDFFTGDNPYLLREATLRDLEYYRLELQEIVRLYESRSWFQKIFYPSLSARVFDLLKRVESDNRLTIFPRGTGSGYSEIYGFKEKLNKLIRFIETSGFINLFNWITYYNNLEKLQVKVVDELKGKDNWQGHFKFFYMKGLLNFKFSTQLPSDEDALLNFKKDVSGLEKEQLGYIRKYWAARQHQAVVDFELKQTNVTIENIYNKKSSSKFKRLSLRQIVQLDPDLFTSFFPVVMTTPDVCCNLFGGLNAYFDIVLFDEASQLRLEDNLPAMLKGKQILIAGDEHQMPPSNYFAKRFDGMTDEDGEAEDDNEIIFDKNNILLSCESLIDFASELKFDKRHLDFHYRSRHPYLIDFSNHAFYKGRLKPLPNKFDYVPITYVQVNGSFIDYANENEAERVLDIIEFGIQRMPDGKYPTIGVATFNVTQRDLILSKILERQRSDKNEAFSRKINELQENGLFIKNLENIQGDERDVIILSTTYGIGKDGKFAQRFAQINHNKGYKLLNVIITRAKHKLYVCTSVPEDIFMNYKACLEAEGTNNKSAVLYAYLAYARAVSEKDETGRNAVLAALRDNSVNAGRELHDEIATQEDRQFETAVIRSIENVFGKNKIVANYKFAGLEIDVLFKTGEGRPHVVIECDGTKVHGSRESYLYDLHRENILKNHGFIFYRIWSVNWWRDPMQQAASLITFLKSIENKTPQIISSIDPTTAFLHDNFEI